MGKRNLYHFRYHDDALRGYRELTLEERGAYTTILDLLYSDQEYLQDNERIIAAEMGVSTRKYRSLRDSLIRKGKIYFVSKGVLSNRRFEEEISERFKRSLSAQTQGKLGGRKKAENEKFRNKINDGSYQTSSSINLEEKNNKNLATNNSSSGGTVYDKPHLIDFQKRQLAAGKKSWG